MNAKGLIRSICSVLLCCCYLAAIVGFDVHVDHHDGEVFVVSLLSGTDCESIHPEDVCHCFEHEHGCCHEDDEDCENIVDVLSLTGTHGDFSFVLSPDLGLVSVVGTPCSTLQTVSFPDTRTTVNAPPRQSLSLFCVLRV